MTRCRPDLRSNGGSGSGVAGRKSRRGFLSLPPACPRNLGSLGQKLCLWHRKHFCLGRSSLARVLPPMPRCRPDLRSNGGSGSGVAGRKRRRGFLSLSPASPENFRSLGQKLCLWHRKHFCLGRTRLARELPPMPRCRPDLRPYGGSGRDAAGRNSRRGFPSLPPTSPENLGSLGQKLCLWHRKHFCLARPGVCRPWPEFGVRRRSSPGPSAVLRRDLGGPGRGWNALGSPMLFSPVKGTALHVLCS